MNINLSEWALGHRRVVWLLVVICLLGGLWAAFQTPKLEDPEIVVRRAVVVGIYPGASAHQMELEVADPLEKAIRMVGEVDYVESTSYADLCYVMVTLAPTVPADKLQASWDLMRHHIERAYLPSSVQLMIRDDFGDVSGMFYALTGEGIAPERLQAYAEMVQRELRLVDEVGRVDLYGKQQPCIQVMLRQEQCAALGVMPIAVVTTLQKQLANSYAGYFESGGKRIRLRIGDQCQSIEQVADLIIPGIDGSPIRLGDLADVTMDVEKPVRQQLRYDGKQAIGIVVAARSGSDVVKVGYRVEQKLEELKRDRLPAGITLHQVFFQPDRVMTAISTFLLNLLESVALVVLILMCCMNIRSGAVVGAVLVVTVLGSIFILSHLDGTLQRVSLAAFILAMGMLVDNSIVIADGIWVSMRQGLPQQRALTEVGRRTAIPLLAATLIAILAFLPIYMSPDVTGLYVRDLFIVLALSLLLSWLFALLLVPLVAERQYRLSPLQGPADKEELFQGKGYNRFRRLLQWALAHRAITLGAALLLLALTALCWHRLPQSLFPDMEYDQAYMEYSLPADYNSTQVEADLDSIRHELEALPYVRHVTTSIGATPGRYCLVRNVKLPSLAYGELIIDFDSPASVRKHLPELQQEIATHHPEALVNFKRYNLMFMPYAVQLFFTGPDPAVLHQLADSMMQFVREEQLLSPVTTDWEHRVPVLEADYEQSKAIYRGVGREALSLSLMAGTEGIPIGSYYDGTQQHTIRLQITDAEGCPLPDVTDAPLFKLMPQLSDLSSRENLLSLASSDRSLPGLTSSLHLDDVGSGVSVTWEDPVVTRYNGKRSHSVMGQPAPGMTAEEVRLRMEDRLQKLSLPAGYSYEWGGEKLATDLSMKYLFRFYPLSLLLMLCLLVWLFNSYRLGMMLFCCLPFLFVGVLPALLISGNHFGFVAIVGILGLAGMLIKNGILLVDEIQHLQAKEMSLDDTLVEATITRLRPVMLASLTTMLGMVPLLFDDMFGAMAASIIGGLLAGTLMTLLLLPVLYSLLYKHQTHE